MRSIEKMQINLLMVLEDKEKDIKRQTKEFVKSLEEEIAELKRSNTELEKLLQSEDLFHLLQVYLTLSTPMVKNNWDEVQINSSLSVKGLMKDLLTNMSTVQLIRCLNQFPWIIREKRYHGC